MRGHQQRTMLTSVFKPELNEIQIKVTEYWEDNGSEFRLNHHAVKSTQVAEYARAYAVDV